MIRQALSIKFSAMLSPKPEELAKMLDVHPTTPMEKAVKDWLRDRTDAYNKHSPHDRTRWFS